MILLLYLDIIQCIIAYSLNYWYYTDKRKRVEHHLETWCKTENEKLLDGKD
jgi:hypothetical protein